MFLLELGSFTNLAIPIHVLKIQTLKLAHTLKIDCFLTSNNAFCFRVKESRKIKFSSFGVSSQVIKTVLPEKKQKCLTVFIGQPCIVSIYIPCIVSKNYLFAYENIYAY